MSAPRASTSSADSVSGSFTVVVGTGIAGRALAFVACAIVLGLLNREEDLYLRGPDPEGVGLLWAGMGVTIAVFTASVIVRRPTRAHWVGPLLELLIATALIVIAIVLGGRPITIGPFPYNVYTLQALAPLAGVWLACAAVMLARSRRP